MGTRKNSKTGAGAEVKAMQWVVGTGDAWDALKLSCAELSAKAGSKAHFVLGTPAQHDGSDAGITKAQAQALAEVKPNCQWVGGLVSKRSVTAVGFWATPMTDAEREARREAAKARKVERLAAKPASADKPARSSKPGKANTSDPAREAARSKVKPAAPQASAPALDPALLAAINAAVVAAVQAALSPKA